MGRKISIRKLACNRCLTSIPRDRPEKHSLKSQKTAWTNQSPSLAWVPLACYGKPGQDFVFYEIDALVERIARDQALFTYLQDCPPRVSVHIGDARVTVARAADQAYSVFVLDAFSGDAIPIHLLTREAVELYLSKLVPDGVLLFHISNRYMDLVPVVDRIAAELKLTAFLRHDAEISEMERAQGREPSTWAILARQPKRLEPFRNDSKWQLLKGDRKGELWTDHYANILPVLRW